MSDAHHTSSANDSEKPGQVSYAILDQTIWARFQDAEAVGEYLEAWLGIMIRQIDGMATGLLVATETLDVGPFEPIASWPAGGPIEDELSQAAAEAVRTRQSVVFGEDAERRILAYPIMALDGLFGAVAVHVPKNAALTSTLFRRIQWGASWIELLLRREQEAKDGDLRERVTVAFDVLATLLERPRLDEAGLALVTDLARRLDCETVSLGLRKRNRMKVQAVSSAASFGRRASMIREVAHAMVEATDQEAVVLWPTPEDWEFRVAIAHGDLAKSHGVGSVLTIPLLSNDEIIGALTFERREDLPFTPRDMEVADGVASIAGPIIEDRRLSGRWLPRKIGASLLYYAKALLGPSHFGKKLATLLVGLVAATLWYTPIDYSISAPARLEGTVQRSIVAPFNGYLASQRARAGDLVEADQVLAVFDENDLSLERLRLSTALSQRLRELDRAIADRDPAQASIIRAQRQQAEAQILLIDEQLARTRITAPFAGYVIEGDLSQSVGASIERGQTMFRIAPLDGFRVVLEISETDIRSIVDGQTGVLRLSAFPEKPLDYRVTLITPLARQGEGRNFFRVEADLLGEIDKLRPGMEGISRTTIEEKRLVWVLLHDLGDWLRLKLWAWQP
ncbi:Multidrug efflux pump subunit AcrA (membrane-fusion protein) [Shimia gijangensis]|uniref:Multidrug efflux pump subunit AcrA (Membrane-fusion protein) n=1 Tax=Shimia gijangensis TaxID=1470563 RepID=A0A1M6QCI1_9RHOB|nr:HlyD family efflux transporter periplasmic adaptor subunit [Shimia gijangensis]SHK17840.1 Multidrug efflux pump subunit AcrA (membrane-fusion protein) [Shimia gijangensis]